MNRSWLLPVAFLFIVSASAVAQGFPPCDVNLLQNPGCDEPIVAGEIPGWTQVGSGWTCQPASLPPWGGLGSFSAGPGDVAELFQDVDVSAYNIDFIWPFGFSGRLRTANESPPDLVRIVFEFRDQASTVLGSFDTGEISPTTDWAGTFRCCEGAANGTQVIRVRLISTRQSALGNDGSFDELNVTPICPLSVEGTRWGLIKEIYR